MQPGQQFADVEADALFDALPDAAWVLDAQGRILKANRAAAADGCDPPPGLAAAMVQARRQGAPATMDYRDTRPGRERHLEARIAALPGPGDRTVVAVRDVTERKQAELALRERDTQFRHLAANITDVLWIRSPDMRKVEYVSPGFERIWGRSMDLHYGNPGQWVSYVHEQDRERVASTFAGLTRDVPSVDVEYRITRPDGEVRWVRARGFQVRDAAGQLIRITGIINDITERKQAQQELEAAQLELLEASRRAGMAEIARASHAELEALMHSLAHDLGAPLMALSSFTQLLARELEGHAVGGKAAHFLSRIQANSSLGLQIIDGLLLLDRVIRAPLQPEPLDLGEMARGMLQELRNTEPQRPAAIVIAEDLWVHADRRLMTLALRHLLDNAWKFSSKQALPRIEVGRQAGPDEQPVYFVRDNGVGFDMAYADKLFRNFQRLHNDSALKGNGVGLVTVSRIVARQGGRVWAESSPGSGAAFYFTLPGVSQPPVIQAPPSR